MKRVFPPPLAEVERQFLPHPGGRGRAKLLHHRALSFYLLFFAVFLLTLTGLDRHFPDVLGFATDIQVDEIIRLTNEERVVQGLTPLKVDGKLAEAAARKAQDMFTDDYWAHVAPDGTEPWDFIDEAGYVYVTAGENLAKDFNRSGSVVKAWMDSPSHRENLLSPKFEDIGVAVVDGELAGFDTTLVVQMFGRTQVSYLASIGEGKATSETPEEAGPTESAVTPKESGPEKVQALEEPAPPASGQGVPVTSSLPAEGYRPLISTRALAGGPLVSKLADLSLKQFALSTSLIFGLFLVFLMMLDIVIVAKRRRLRVTARTLVHLALLIFLLVGIWYSQIGAIL